MAPRHPHVGAAAPAEGTVEGGSGGGNREDPYADCTEEYVLATLTRTKLAARPGTRFAYSNLGAGLLGIALARRAGLPYDELVAREITMPLGLSDTSVAVPPAHAARLAAGHTKRRKPTSAWDMASLAGAGGLHSTAQDLLAFVRVHLDVKAVADQAFADALRLARARQFELAAHHHVHLGWMSMQPKGSDTKRLYWHNGRTGGFASWIGFVPKRRAGVVVLSNTARSVDRTGMGLLRTIGG
ncbi:serine hydrolase domain-containing protein [Yinghuangia aomiensis]